MPQTYHDVLLGLLETVFVGDAFELVTLLDETCILHLDIALLFHDLGDLFRHHLRHFLAHVVLKHLQIVQLFNHLHVEATKAHNWLERLSDYKEGEPTS